MQKARHEHVARKASRSLLCGHENDVAKSSTKSYVNVEASMANARDKHRLAGFDFVVIKSLTLLSQTKVMCHSVLTS